MKIKYSGTPVELATHLHGLADEAQSEADNDHLTQRERRFKAGCAEGLRTAAVMVANFEPVTEDHDGV